MMKFYVHAFDKYNNPLFGKTFVAENSKMAEKIAKKYILTKHKKNNNLKNFRLAIVESNRGVVFHEPLTFHTYSVMF